MFGDVKIRAKFNMKGNMTKGFLLMLANLLTFFLFTVYTCSSCYIFCINNSFFDTLAVFSNYPVKIIFNAVICIIGIVLMLFHVSVRYKTQIWFLEKSENTLYDKKVTVKTAFKLWLVYFSTFIFKALSFLVFLLPGIVLGILINIAVSKGIMNSLAVIFASGDIVVLSAGIICGFVYIQRYSNVIRFFGKDNKRSVRNLLISSFESMNGLSSKLLKLKLSMLPRLFLSLFIIPGIYFLPYCKAVTAEFTGGKIKIPQKRTACAEKPVTFLVRNFSR